MSSITNENTPVPLQDQTLPVASPHSTSPVPALPIGSIQGALHVEASMITSRIEETKARNFLTAKVARLFVFLNSS